MQHKNLNISFELFPPKSEQGLNNLLATAKSLAEFNPEFFSVTYGAGGSSKAKTFETIFFLLERLNCKIIPHLTCIGSTKNEIRKILQIYIHKGIKHLVALRGDLPDKNIQAQDFKYANDLVTFIRKETDDHFHIDIAAYPEFHPDAINPKVDLSNLQKKVTAGANRAITQYFFNIDTYLHFRDDCAKLNINIPIVPGIMPIYNWEKLKTFSQISGADLPIWMFKRLEHFSDDKDSMRAYGCEVITKLCEQLIQAGVPGFHFYTLNKKTLTTAILNNLDINSRTLL